MENNDLNKKFMQVLNEVPNFSTDETANAGSRTYKYLNLATLLKNIKPIFEKHDLAFSQKVTFNGTGDGRQTLGTVETIIFDETNNRRSANTPSASPETHSKSAAPSPTPAATALPPSSASSRTRTTTEATPNRNSTRPTGR